MSRAADPPRSHHFGTHLGAEHRECAGVKLKAIGKAESGLLACQAVAAKSARSGLSACQGRATAKLSAAFARAGTCGGDQTRCEDIVDGCDSAMAAFLMDAFPSRCESTKRKAAGQLARAELRCYAIAAANEIAVDAGCIARARGRFGVAIANAGACPDGGSPQNEVEGNCVQPAVATDGGGTVTDVCPTSTTTTTLCCGVAPTRLSFTTSSGSGNCGTSRFANGSVRDNLVCGGLYPGGGANTVPLPLPVPDMGNSIAAISACAGTTLALANLTSVQTGSNRNCTSVGCLFGPPLPIPNAGNTPTSVCVVSAVAADASGLADCSTGALSLSLPLSWTLFLDGDLFPNAPGIQPCPVCNHTCSAGTNAGGPCNIDADCPSGGTGSCAGANVCHGGPNDSMACTPADSALNASFPTSHDCPPPPGNNIGGLPINFALTTATTTMTAATLSGQLNVFCGFCRDAGGTATGDPPSAGTGCFEGFPDPACPHNGTCVGASDPWNCCTASGTGSCDPGTTRACSSPTQCTDGNGTWPDCQQRDSGAFGPAGGGVHTITESGSPAGDMTDGTGHASTLASIFCIPPPSNLTVYAAEDLPGPGAISFPVTAQLLP